VVKKPFEDPHREGLISYTAVKRRAFSVSAKSEDMAFEKGDRVVFHDKHSDYDGETGEVTQVSETMFGDNTYIVDFEEGQEAGIAEESLEPAEDDE
jgi:hypothetical protein